MYDKNETGENDGYLHFKQNTKTMNDPSIPDHPLEGRGITFLRKILGLMNLRKSGRPFNWGRVGKNPTLGDFYDSVVGTQTPWMNTILTWLNLTS